MDPENVNLSNPKPSLKFLQKEKQTIAKQSGYGFRPTNKQMDQTEQQTDHRTTIYIYMVNRRHLPVL